MLRRRAYVRLRVALAFTSVTLFTTFAYGQSPVIPPVSPDKGAAAAQGARSSNPEKNVAAKEPRPGDLENEVAAMKAENAAVREQLRKMEDQQKSLLELVDGLRRKLDGNAIADPRVAQPPGMAEPARAAVPSTAATETAVPSPPVSMQPKPKDDDRYQDGIVIWQTPDDARVPFLLQINNNTQVRYLN